MTATIQEIQEYAATLVEHQKIYRKDIKYFEDYIAETTDLMDRLKKSLDKDFTLNQVIQINSYINHFLSELFQQNPTKLNTFTKTIERYNRRVISALQYGAGNNRQYEPSLNTLFLQPEFAYQISEQELSKFVNIMKEANRIYSFEMSVPEAKKIPYLAKGSCEENLAILLPIVIRLLEAYYAIFLKADEAKNIVAGLAAKIKDAEEKLAKSQANLDETTQNLAIAQAVLRRADEAYFDTSASKHAPAGINVPLTDKKKMNQELDELAKRIALKQTRTAVKQMVRSGYLGTLINTVVEKFPDALPSNERLKALQEGKEQAPKVDAGPILYQYLAEQHNNQAQPEENNGGKNDIVTKHYFNKSMGGN